MRTDIERIVGVTEEMKLNDRLYREMCEELDRRIEFIAEFAPKLLCGEFETLYFWRRVLSVLKNHDLPFHCAVGLFFLSNRLEVLSSLRHSYIDDEDDEAEIFKYILEVGYKAYDELTEPEADTEKPVGAKNQGGITK